jgi:hypothetical protein
MNDGSLEEEPDPHQASRSEALKQKNHLEDLLKSPGWSMVLNFLAEQKKVRITKLLTDQDLPDKELHFIRGEAATYEVLEKWPAAMLAVTENILTAIRGDDGRPSELPRNIDDVDLPPVDEFEPESQPGSIGDPRWR